MEKKYNSFNQYRQNKIVESKLRESTIIAASIGSDTSPQQQSQKSPGVSVTVIDQTLDDGSKIVIDKETAEKLFSVYEDLNSENKVIFRNLLNRNVETYQKIVDFCDAQIKG